MSDAPNAPCPSVPKMISANPSEGDQEKEIPPSSKSPAIQLFKLPLPPVEKDPEGLDAKLLAIADRALGKATEILRAPFNSNNGVLARAQTAIVKTALTTQTRVDENRFRTRSPDVLAKLLEIMAEEKAKLPKRVQDDTPVLTLKPAMQSIEEKIPK